MSISIEPIGHVRGGRVEVEDDNWGNVVAVIELSDTFGSEALASLGEFSHAEIIFVFDRVPDGKIERGARHPRGRTDWPLVGIFAQRGKNRPNRIGSTIAEVLAVQGRTVRVRGLDAVDGTPVLDIKRVMTGFMPRGELREPTWASEIMADYW